MARPTPTDRLIRSRLAPPRLPAGVLRRGPLLERVQVALEVGAISVTAGAGYGKTTLLAQAVSESYRPVVWISCDERLRTPAVFVEHLVAGFEEIVPGFGAGFPSKGPDEAVLTRLVNEMVLTIAEDTILIVDDVQTLPGPVVEALKRITRDGPKHVHVGVAGRRDSPLSRADLTNRRHLTITENDLRLDFEEAAELFALAGLTVDPETLRTLTERTEGWVSGLLLAGQAGRSLEDTLAAPNPEIFSLLADEVFDAQPPAVREFLLGTAVLERFTPELAAEVTGIGEAEAMTADILTRHLFCTSLEAAGGTWYRYHQLFGDYLRLRLGVRAPRRRELHERCAAALARRGMHGEAIRHYLEAGEHARALSLLEAHAEELSRGPEAPELRGWLARVAQDAWWSRPGIVAARAARILVEESDYDASTEEADAAVERLLELDDHGRAAFLLAKLAQTRIMGGLGRREGLERSSRSLARLRTDSLFVPIAQMALAGGYGWHCDFDRAEVEVDAALASPAARDSPLCEAYAEMIRAHLIDRVRGHVVAAPKRLEGVIDALELLADEDELAFVVYASSYRAFALSYLGRHHEVFREIARTERLALERGQGPHPGYVGGWLRTTAHADEERWEELARELSAIERSGGGLGGSAMSYFVTAFRGQLAASRGDVASAAGQIALGEWQMLETIGGPDFIALCDLGHAARLAGLRDEQERLLEEARSVASDAGADWGTARASLLLADVRGRGRGDSALADSLALSAENAYEDLWAYKERRVVSDLLARALEDELGPPGYARRLVALCGGEVLEHLVSSDGSRRPRRSGNRIDLPAERAALTIRVLGDFAVLRGPDVLPDSAFGRERARTLLAVLCAYPEGIPRDDVLEWLWPRLPPERGTRALSTTLHALRRAIEPHLSNRARGSRITQRNGRCRLSLNEGDLLDAERFLTAANEGLAATGEARVAALAAAESRFVGEPFANWRYEPWAEAPRARVTRALEDVLARLAHCLLETGDLRGAASRFEALVAIDPLREEWHRGVMDARAAAGETALALRQFHECRTRLREEQGTEPGEETRGLYTRILQGGDSPDVGRRRHDSRKSTIPDSDGATRR